MSVFHRCFLALGLIFVVNSSAFAQMNPADIYLEETQQFLRFHLQIQDLSEEPRIFNGKTCRFWISGTKSYGGYEVAYIKVKIEKNGITKIFHHYNHTGDIQRPQITVSPLKLSVGGSRVFNQTYDGESYEVEHRYLHVSSNKISIEDFDGSVLGCSF